MKSALPKRESAFCPSGFYKQFFIRQIGEKGSERGGEKNGEHRCGQYDPAASEPRGERNGADRRLYRRFRGISDHTEQPLFFVQSGFQNADKDAEHTKEQCGGDDRGDHAPPL